MSNFPGKTFFRFFLIFLNFFFVLVLVSWASDNPGGSSTARLWRTSQLDRLVPYSLASAGAQEWQVLPRIELETNVVPQLCFGALLPHTALSNNGAAKRKCSRMRNAEKKSERLALAWHWHIISYHIISYSRLYPIALFALYCSGTGIFPPPSS